MTEDKWTFRGQEHLVNRLENDLLHRWEVEILDGQLCAVLDVDAQVNLLFVIVLDAKDQAKIQSVLVPVLLHEMDQIVEN